MIVCPRCSYENEDSAMNCANCRINLQWALENEHEVAQDGLQREEGLERAAKWGALTIVVILAIPLSVLGALMFFVSATMDTSGRRGGDVVLGVGCALVAVICILAAIAMLLPRRLRPRFYRGLRILALIALAGSLLFGLMQLTLVILPEHTGRSLIIQYKLGERDFRGATLEGADLREANLRKANLSGANLGRVDLREADLRRANFSRADLREANLSGAHLQMTDLSGADLREADLSGVVLLFTDLSGADLREADLTGADVTGAQLDRAGNLERTILPDGSVHE